MFKWIGGMFSWLLGFQQKKGKVLLLGLDNAGKTTLLNYMKTGRLQQYMPTLHENHQEVVIGGVSFDCFDLGGQKSRRKMWAKMLHVKPTAVIFVIDASSIKRLDEASCELANIIDDPALKDTPILIFGNKVDKDNALSEAQLVQHMNLTDFQKQRSKRTIRLFMCSLLLRAGVKEGLQWLIDKI